MDSHRADVGLWVTIRIRPAGTIQSNTNRIFGTALVATTYIQDVSPPLSSRTKWQRLPTDDTLRSVPLAGNRSQFVLPNNDGSCPTADLSNIRLSQWSGLFNRSAVEHTPELLFGLTTHTQRQTDMLKTIPTFTINLS